MVRRTKIEYEKAITTYDGTHKGWKYDWNHEWTSISKKATQPYRPEDEVYADLLEDGGDGSCIFW